MRETRDYRSEFEIREKPTGGVVIDGHAAVFGKLSENLGGFVEQVRAGAFTDTIPTADVRALFNHDSNLILGRTAAGTLRIAEDSLGLAYDFDLPDTTAGRDLQVSMERGDITQSSFGFFIEADSWGQTNDGYPMRTLERVSLHNGDVSPVTYPAYHQTDSGIAHALRSLVDDAHPLDELLAAAKAGALRDVLTEDTAAHDERVVAVPLSVARASLQHLERPTRWPQLTNG